MSKSERYGLLLALGIFTTFGTIEGIYLLKSEMAKYFVIPTIIISITLLVYWNWRDKKKSQIQTNERINNE